MLADPTGRFVYSGGDQGVFVYSSNPVTGQLTYAIPSGSNDFFNGYGHTTLGVNTRYEGLALHPSGRFLFAARFIGVTGTLDSYQVDGNNGGLTWTATIPTGPSPRAVVVDPSGKFVYTVNRTPELAVGLQRR